MKDEVNGELSQLGQDITTIENTIGNIDYTNDFISGKAINLGSYSIGSVVPLTPVSNSVISYFLTNTKKGEKYILTGTGTGGPRLYGILDTDRKLLSVAASDVTQTNFEIEIEQDGYLVVNVLTNNTHSLTSNGIKEDIAKLEQEISQNTLDIQGLYDKFPDFEVELKRGWYGTGGTFNASNYRVYTNKFPLRSYKLRLKDGFCFQTVLYYNEQGQRVFGWDTYLNYQQHYVDSPIREFESNGAYKCVFSIRRVTEDTSETISTDPAYFIEELLSTETDLYQYVESKADKTDCDVNLNNTIIWGAYITTDIAVGQTVNPSLITGVYLYGCSIIKCKKGDTFYISTNGGGYSQPGVAFVDSSFILLSKYSSEYKSTKIAPADGYLITNHTTSSENLIIKKNTQQYNIIGRSRWGALGDSITESYYSYFTDEAGDVGVSARNEHVVYPLLAASMKNCEFRNFGVGGMGFLAGGQNNARALAARTDFSNFDLVTIAFGINDYKAPSRTLGNISDGVGGDVSVVSNMRYVIEKIISDNPACKIVVITPLNARGYDRELGDESTNYAIGHQNSLGYTLNDMYNKMVEVCEYYGIAYIDFTHSSVINRKSIRKLTPDGVHPSIEAHKTLAREIINQLPI